MEEAGSGGVASANTSILQRVKKWWSVEKNKAANSVPWSGNPYQQAPLSPNNNRPTVVGNIINPKASSSSSVSGSGITNIPTTLPGTGNANTGIFVVVALVLGLVLLLKK